MQRGDETNQGRDPESLAGKMVRPDDNSHFTADVAFGQSVPARFVPSVHSGRYLMEGGPNS